MNRNFIYALVALAALAPLSASAQSDSEFTYQGTLDEAGQAAEGPHDMEFSLWNALVDGSQIGPIILQAGVPVTGGLFTAQLDFDADAFDHAGRWLELTVNGHVLSPRQPITPSPYSIKTRGIYVDADNNVGIGTNEPQHLLHVVGDTNAANAIYGYSTELSNTAAGVFGRSASSNGYGVYGHASALNGGNYGVFGKADGSFGYGVYAYASHLAGQTYGVYSRSISNNGTGVYGFASNPTGTTQGVWGRVSSPDGFAGRFDGRGYFSDNVGFGTLSPVAGQLTIAASGPGTIHAIEATSNTTVFPTIYAVNSAPSGSVLWADGSSDATPSAGGIIVAGNEFGKNIAIDADEIMARDSGQPSTLHLNADGGQINMGLHNIHPALAYGKIYYDGTLLSGSPNITSVVRTAVGQYSIQIEGGVLGGDILLASNAGVLPFMLSAHIEDNEAHVWTYDDGGDDADLVFNFIIYRP